MAIEVIAKISQEIAKASKEIASEVKKQNANIMSKLDRPLGEKDLKEVAPKEGTAKGTLKDLDKPLNAKDDVKPNTEGTSGAEKTDSKVEKLERMEPPIQIEFKCPEGMDKREFTRQLKGQERGLNSQSVGENMKNRAAFEQRKLETGNGRDLETGKKAQEIARQKATQSRIESNQKKGMSYSEAKAEANSWIKSQAALHNPDQIAGGDPSKVSRMGDSGVNSSIGSQWRTRVEKLDNGVKEFAKNKTAEELANIKMNVKLVAV